MSAPSDQQAASELSRRQRQILSVLEDRIPDQTYFKSREIAAELDFSSKAVGVNMARLQEETDLTIEQWGYSSSTTWKVSP